MVHRTAVVLHIVGEELEMTILIRPHPYQLAVDGTGVEVATEAVPTTPRAASAYLPSVPYGVIFRAQNEDLQPSILIPSYGYTRGIPAPKIIKCIPSFPATVWARLIVHCGIAAGILCKDLQPTIV